MQPTHAGAGRFAVRLPMNQRVLANLLITAIALVALGCQASGPSNSRNWSADQAVLPYAEFDGPRVQLHNIRNCSYRTTDDFTVSYYDKTFDLEKLNRVDFIMVPFSELPEGAHTMLSFGFNDDDYLGISVEVRREKGETYSITKSLANGFELMYVIADERDLIALRTNQRLDDVYLYRANATPEQARALLVDMLERANQLRNQPEYYHLITNNCTTNIMRHINRISPGRVPYNYEVLFSGYSDRLAYRLGLIGDGQSFERAKLAARVNKLAYVHRESPDFSKNIRR